ncbi:KTSC domain-containing protein [Muriicola sp. Z0-33]|uniref:KTSC domain-containing protein n=1 Tax=Muriicola sp. Z0-33 TaxID=2816957 RepID=UPI002238502B|nr:KTSC domain-containing protein [Muriicola sp. Z0-33]MCW5516930.1 KTSC domain-containing protein [Muriicola sp. Z0-33]
MERTPVSSSNLVSVGYNPETNTLEVEFKGGTVYQYFDVPLAIYEELINAGSLGVYFAANIRENYDFEKL